MLSRTVSMGALVLLTLPLILQIQIVYILQKAWHFLIPCPVSQGDSFDFIVVGAGSAGSAVAGRLAESGHQVLLVEAGGPPHYLQYIPALWCSFLSLPNEYSWPYQTEPQKNAFDYYQDNKITIPHGKSLGGSSMLNGMLYVRGSSKDYDEWESLGNQGWGWEDVYPYFKKAEKLHNVKSENPKSDGIDKEFHGQEGKVHVMPLKESSPAAEMFVQGVEELGYKTGDYNGGDQDDEVIYHPGQVTNKNGFRADTFSSYIKSLRPKERSNLKVLTYAHVNKLLLEEGDKVTGVTVDRFGKQMTLRVKKEVVLSAGSIQSPKILMHSGIGPEKHLKEMGIEVVKHLPGVGSNLHDHIAIPHIFYSKNSSGLSTNPFDVVNHVDMLRYGLTGEGLPFSDNGIGTGTFVKSARAHHNGDSFNRTDLQMVLYPVSTSTDYGLALNELFGKMKDSDSYQKIFLDKNNYEQYEAIMVLIILLRPKSRGALRLRSSDPQDLPNIDPKYLTNTEDMKTLEAGMKWASQLSETRAFKKHQFKELPMPYLCPDESKTYECLIHLADRRTLKVHGVKQLRVIDASVMPRVVGGNTNAATIMIGEKGADIILKDWLGQKKIKESKVKDEL